MRAPTLFTIGYEGATLEAFIATLKRAGIELVIDVRAVVSSRKPGFSKNALRAALADAGIGYLHQSALGTPKRGRDAARAGNRERFRAVMDARLASVDALRALDGLSQTVDESRACLMCFERDPTQCHRTLVAGEIGRRRALEVRDLFVEG